MCSAASTSTSQETKLADNEPGPKLSDFLLIPDVVERLGWMQDEFVDATENYQLPATDYNWDMVLQNLWKLTHARIHSQLDLTFRFVRYNDWGEIIPFALAINRDKILSDEYAGDLTIAELEVELDMRRKSVLLPTEDIEKRVVWALVHLVLQLHSFLCKYPEAAFYQLKEMRRAAEKRKEDAEKRREARYFRRQAQKKKKRSRR